MITSLDNTKFNKDIEKLLTLCRDSFDICETITDNFYNWRADEYRYNENGMFYVLYDIVNYDMISLCGGKIDINNSNHPDVAKILKKYATPETITMVYDRIYRN